MPHQVPVVAVFGSKGADTLEPALAVGEAVAVAGCVLLTGGGREPTERSVKEQAMNGARRAERDGHRGARVGVLGVESTRVHLEVDESQVILEPALGHDRNYVNAAMCDVAVAFPGGEGTDSEVAFALALGRPVVLVGDRWERAFPTDEGGSARRHLIESAKGRVKGRQGRDIDDLVNRAYRDLPSAVLTVRRVTLDEPAADIVASAVALAEGTGLPGDVPHLADRPDLEPLAEDYRAWLSGIHPVERRA